MARLEDLERDLQRALTTGDLTNAAAVRRTIAEGFPGTSAAAEANFKLGLFHLFKERNLDAAATALRAAAKAKDQVWSPQARVSLGLVLMRQGKHQQAVFELRRVAGLQPPSLVTAQAAGLVVIGLREAGNGQEAERARAQQLQMLERLTKSDEPQTRAMAQHMLGVEHKHDGRRDRARPLLEAAIASGALPEPEREQAQASLLEL